MIRHLSTAIRILSVRANWVQSLALLAARLWMAKIFFKSGLLKVQSWSTTLALFEEEYHVPLLSPEVAAVLATVGELSLPVLLALGLFTPFAAFGLMIMTLVIELFVYPGTNEHSYWMLIFGVLMTHGSGRVGVDFLLLNKPALFKASS